MWQLTGLGLILAATGAASERVCAWGDGQAAPQPAGYTNTTTCTPPSLIGTGQTILTHSNVDATDYLDVQVFRYPTLPSSPPNGKEQAVRGRKVRTERRGNITVALIATGADGCTACGGSPDCPHLTSAECLNKTLSDLTAAGQLGVDLAVLPENWPMQELDGGAVTDPPPQPISGPDATLIATVAALARAYKMNVVAPIREARGGRFYNTAVVIDRTGQTVGHYSKVFPVWGSQDRTAGEILHVSPSEEGVKVFDLDIGKVAILICFDINFGELWHQAAALGADLFVWPSAMKTPDPTSYGYARIHRVPVVAVGYPGDVVDSTGLQLPTRTLDGHPNVKLAEMDLTGVWVHWDYNIDKVKQLLADHPNDVTLQVPGPPFYLLRATTSNVSIAALVQLYGIETAASYIGRSRHGINVARQLGLQAADSGGH